MKLFLLVSRKMSKFPSRFTLICYNVSGVSSIKMKNNIFEVSKFYAVLNPLVMILAFASSLYVTFTASIHLMVNDTITASFDFYSSLSIIVTVANAYLIKLFAIILTFLQLSKHRNGVELLNDCNQSLKDNKSADVLLQQSKKIMVCCISIFTVVFIAFTCATTNWTVLSFVLGLLWSFPCVTLLVFMIFTKHLGMLLTTLLKGFRKDFKKLRNRTNFDENANDKLMRDYQNIYDLNQEFNKVFGFQLTMLTCCLTLIIILQVISQICF